MAGRRPNRSGNVARVVDHRTGYVSFRGRVQINRRFHTVSVGVRDGRSEAATERDCWRLLRRKIREVEEGLSVDRRRDRRVDAAFRAWLDEKRLTLRGRSLENYVRMVDRWIVPALGTKMLSELTRADVAGLLKKAGQPYRFEDTRGAKQDRPGMAPAGINLLHTVLTACLRHAADVEHRPVDRAVLSVKPPPVPRQAVRVYAPEQVRRLLDGMAERGDPLRPLWVLAVYTGARLGELLGLRWRHVDLGRRVVLVVEKLPPRRQAGGPDWEPTKTSRAAEKPLSDEAAAALAVHRATVPANPHDLVFVDKLGRPISQAIARGAFERATRAAGLPELPPKQLRHTFGTALRRAGVSIDTASQLIGHSRLSTTDEHYVAPVTAEHVDAVRRLETMLRGGN